MMTKNPKRKQVSYSQSISSHSVLAIYILFPLGIVNLLFRYISVKSDIILKFSAEAVLNETADLKGEDDDSDDEDYDEIKGNFSISS